MSAVAVVAGAPGPPQLDDTASGPGACATSEVLTVRRRPLWRAARLVVTLAALAVIAGYFVLPELRQAHWSLLAHVAVPWLALGHVVPAGSAASAALGYRLFTRNGVKPADVCFTLASQGPGSSVVLNVMLWLALLASIPFTGFDHLYLAAAIAGCAVLTGAGLLVYLFTKGEERVVRVLRRLVAPLSRVRQEAAERLVRSVACSVEDLRRDPCPLLLAGSGVTKGIATLAVIGWRLVSFWMPIPFGAGAYLSLVVFDERRFPTRRLSTEVPATAAGA